MNIAPLISNDQPKHHATFGCLGDNLKAYGVCVCVCVCVCTLGTENMWDPSDFFLSFFYGHLWIGDPGTVRHHPIGSCHCSVPPLRPPHSTAQHSGAQPSSVLLLLLLHHRGKTSLLLTSPRILLSSSAPAITNPPLSARFDGRTCCLCGSEEEEEETGGRRWWLVLLLLLLLLVVLVEVGGVEGREGGGAGWGDLCATVWSSRGGASCWSYAAKEKAPCGEVRGRLRNGILLWCVLSADFCERASRLITRRCRRHHPAWCPPRGPRRWRWTRTRSSVKHATPCKSTLMPWADLCWVINMEVWFFFYFMLNAYRDYARLLRLMRFYNTFNIQVHPCFLFCFVFFRTYACF